MENGLRNYSNTLMSELGTWNRQERAIKEVFGDESIKDRDFLKIKLQEYERLSSRFVNNIFTPDERAMMTMLKYQRRKLVRTVYPGLIARMMHNVVILFKPALDNKREMEMARQAGLRTYTDIQLPAKQQNAIGEQQKESIAPRQPHQQAQQQRPHRSKHQHKKRRSI